MPKHSLPDDFDVAEQRDTLLKRFEEQGELSHNDMRIYLTNMVLTIAGQATGGSPMDNEEVAYTLELCADIVRENADTTD